MEAARLAILYVHLLACCVAVGITLVNDLHFLRRLLFDTRVDRRRADIDKMQFTVLIALGLLWLSGAGLIAWEIMDSGMQILANPKLQAKILVCALLTVNGLLLHAWVLPAMQTAGSLLRLPQALLNFSIICASVSAVSWLYAAFLGIARGLSWKYSVSDLLVAYPVCILSTWIALQLAIVWSRRRRGPEIDDVPSILDLH